MAHLKMHPSYSGSCSDTKADSNTGAQVRYAAELWRQADLEKTNVNPDLLMIASAGIIGFLGLVHLVFTLWGPKHLPRDMSLSEAMANTAPEITSQTTIWRMWMGFNTSHSMALMFFGLTYSYLALAHSEFLFQSFFLQALGLGMLAGYVVIARLYFFIAPLAGASLALVLYLVSIAVAWSA